MSDQTAIAAETAAPVVAPPYGYVDQLVDGNLLTGWARGSTSNVNIELYDKDVLIGRAIANEMRGDMGERVAFSISLPDMDTLELSYKIFHGNILAIAESGGVKAKLNFFSGLMTHAATLLFGARGKSSFNALRRSSQWGPQRDVHIASLKDAVLLLMVRDESEIITHNLEHHYRLGFRRFFILDNRSVDDTAEKIIAFRKKYLDAEVFYGYDYIIAYTQHTKMRALEAFVTAYLSSPDVVKPDWLFVVDADEFITVCTTDTNRAVAQFNEALSDEKCMGLLFHWAHCSSPVVYKDSSDIKDLFAEYPNIWPEMKVAISKVAFRLGHNLKASPGSHVLAPFPPNLSAVKVMNELGVAMLHFPHRSVEHLRRKIMNGYEVISALKGNPEMGAHWRRDYEAYQQQGDEFLVNALNQSMLLAK